MDKIIKLLILSYISLLLFYQTNFAQTSNDSTKIFLIAHRGGSSLGPENTIYTFSKGFQAGADGIELDIQLTADDSIIVCHDDRVDRTTNGKGLISALRYSQIKALDAGSWFDTSLKGIEIPTLYEVLKTFNNKKIFIEIKTDNFSVPRKLIALLKRGNYTEGLWFLAFNNSKLDSIKKIENMYPVVYLVNVLSDTAINLAKNKGYEFIGAAANISGELVQYAKQNKIDIIAWTINDAKKMKELGAVGVKYIITDYPQYKNTSLQFQDKNKNELNNILDIKQIQNNINIKIYSEAANTCDITMYNLLGQKILENSPTLIKGINAVNVNIGRLSSGMYLFIIKTNHVLYKRKTLIIK